MFVQNWLFLIFINNCKAMLDKINKVMQKNFKKYNQGPLLFIDKEKIKENYHNINQLSKRLEVFYSVKANPNKDIMKIISKLGGGFEVDSIEDLKNAVKLVSAEKIISTGPLKSEKFLKLSHNYGVRNFTFDNSEELEKIAKVAPQSNVSLQLKIDNSTSFFPVAEKYGCFSNQAVELFKYAKKLKLKPFGLNFNIGSCSNNHEIWGDGLVVCKGVIENLLKNKIKIKKVNIGGGFPINKEVSGFHIEDVKQNLDQVINKFFSNYKDIKFQATPGRYIVGNSGVMYSKVIAKKKIGLENWLYLNVGVYNGLFEAIFNYKYKLISQRQVERSVGNYTSFYVGGPSGSNIDIVSKDSLMPEDIKNGDSVFILNAGANTANMSTSYNSFPVPSVIML